MQMQNPNIVIVGAGNIAAHLTKRFLKKGLPVAQVINRNPERARRLVQDLGQAIPSGDLGAVLPDADWYVLTVSDQAIGEVATFLQKKTDGKGLVTHVSGATPSSIFSGKLERYGVFYPLQSFSKNSKPAWTKIPICVHANQADDVLFLKKMGRRIAQKVVEINDAQRADLHLSAVFANNFTNHLYAIAEALLKEKSIPMKLLHPLMEETLHKALKNPPRTVQTGPALRGDADTMRRHLKALEAHPLWRALYGLISEDIGTMA